MESCPDLTLVSFRKCQWDRQKGGHARQAIETFLDQHFPGRSEKRQSPAQLLHGVQGDTFFGALEVDIETPPHLKDKFSEMTPMFSAERTIGMVVVLAAVR